MSTLPQDLPPDQNSDVPEEAERFKNLREYFEKHPETLDELVENVTDRMIFEFAVSLILNGFLLGVSRYLSERTTLDLRSLRARAGLLLKLTPNSVWKVFDPVGVLRDHCRDIGEWFSQFSKTELKQLPELTDDQDWHEFPPQDVGSLLCCATRSTVVECQVWFMEKPRGITCLVPLQRWLLGAAAIFEQTIGTKGGVTPVPHAGGHSLQNYAQYAVSDVIEQHAPDIHAFQVLGALAELTVTSEERSKSTGHIHVLPPDDIDRQTYLWRFAQGERPSLLDAKHVCKLLSASTESHPFIASNRELFGLSDSAPSEGLYAQFEAGKATLSTKKLGPICKILHGQFHAVYDFADNGISEMLIASKILADGLDTLIVDIVKHVRLLRHGCTVVIHQVGSVPSVMSAQRLHAPVLLDQSFIPVVARMACIDGAVVLDGRGYVSAFACILDGPALGDEVRSRGARYNSALRYSTKHKDSCILVVVSEDGPATVIQSGKDLSRPIEYQVPGMQASKQYGEWIADCSGVTEDGSNAPPAVLPPALEK